MRRTTDITDVGYHLLSTVSIQLKRTSLRQTGEHEEKEFRIFKPPYEIYHEADVGGFIKLQSVVGCYSSVQPNGRLIR
jgi:hypothetical protein